MKILIVLALLAAVVSLGLALYYMNKDRGGSDRMVRALRWRVVISVLLFAFLFVAWGAGLIQPHGIGP